MQRPSYSLIVKVVAVRIFRRRVERKIEDVFGEDQFVLEGEKAPTMQLGC
jgi:hypothetical protein